LVTQVGVCIRVRWGARAEIQTTSGAKCSTARPEFSTTYATGLAVERYHGPLRLRLRC